MVSAGVPPPVWKSVEDAVAVQEALSSARSSVTVTAPRGEEMVAPTAPEPRSEASGAVIASAPVVTVKVTVVGGSPAAGPLKAAVLVVTAHPAVGVSPIATMAAALILAPTTLRMNPQ